MVRKTAPKYSYHKRSFIFREETTVHFQYEKRYSFNNVLFVFSTIKVILAASISLPVLHVFPLPAKKTKKMRN